MQCWGGGTALGERREQQREHNAVCSRAAQAAERAQPGHALSSRTAAAAAAASAGSSVRAVVLRAAEIVTLNPQAASCSVRRSLICALPCAPTSLARPWSCGVGRARVDSSGSVPLPALAPATLLLLNQCLSPAPLTQSSDSLSRFALHASVHRSASGAAQPAERRRGREGRSTSAVSGGERRLAVLCVGMRQCFPSAQPPLRLTRVHAEGGEVETRGLALDRAAGRRRQKERPVGAARRRRQRSQVVQMRREALTPWRC